MKRIAVFISCALFIFCLTISNEQKANADQNHPGFRLTINIGHAYYPGDTSYDAWEDFKTLVERESKGQIIVNLYPEGALGYEDELMADISTNTLDMTSVNVARLCETFPKFTLFVLPYIWRDERHMFNFCDGADGKKLAEEFKIATGMAVLAYWDNGVRHTCQTKKPVLSPDDYNGMKIRVMDNEIYLKFFSALGAQPMPMAFGEIYTALQVGVVEAADGDTSSYLAMHFYEPAKYFSLTAHVISCKPVLASADLLKKVDALPENLKKIFYAAVETIKNSQRSKYLAKAQKDIVEMETKLGVKVNDVPDKEAFRAIAQRDVWPLFKDAVSEELITATEQYYSLKK